MKFLDKKELDFTVKKCFGWIGFMLFMLVSGVIIVMLFPLYLLVNCIAFCLVAAYDLFDKLSDRICGWIMR